MRRRSAAELLLGVDAGTTLCKAAIYAADGACLGRGEAKQGVKHPKPGWAEQDPGSWWRGLGRAVRQALGRAQLRGEGIAAIGLSTQGGTVAVFDEKGRPRGPALVWSDARQLAPEEEDSALEDEHFRLTGIPRRRMTPAAIRWLKRRRPEWFATPFRIGYVPDYLTFRLTGDWVSDPTNLGISSLCDLATGDIPLPVIARLGVPREAFATTRPAGEMAGRLLPHAARALGLRAGIPVATPAHDQYAAALGAGCVEPGDLLLSAGTAWVLVLTTSQPLIDRVSSFLPGRHVQSGCWGLLGAISSGSSTLEQLLLLTHQRADWEKVNAAAARIPPGCDGLLVIPHLVGRTLPTPAPKARGAILGWSLGHSRAHLWRAALEGLACEVRAAFEYLAARGAEVKRLRMVGGAGRSSLAAEIVASLLDLPVTTCVGEDLAVRGAASLASRVLGESDLPPPAKWVEHAPVAAWREAYRATYARYRQALAQLEEECERG